MLVRKLVNGSWPYTCYSTRALADKILRYHFSNCSWEMVIQLFWLMTCVPSQCQTFAGRGRWRTLLWRLTWSATTVRSVLVPRHFHRLHLLVRSYLCSFPTCTVDESYPTKGVCSKVLSGVCYLYIIRFIRFWWKWLYHLTNLSDSLDPFCTIETGYIWSENRCWHWLRSWGCMALRFAPHGSCWNRQSTAGNLTEQH